MPLSSQIKYILNLCYHAVRCRWSTCSGVPLPHPGRYGPGEGHCFHAAMIANSSKAVQHQLYLEFYQQKLTFNAVFPSRKFLNVVCGRQLVPFKIIDKTSNMNISRIGVGN
jgi:hypothetical protein